MRYRDALIYSWQLPKKDGGSALQYYHLELQDPKVPGTTRSFNLTVQATNFRFENLVPATDYVVRIKVNNLVGESDWSEYVGATTGIEPTTPGILTFSRSTRTTLDFYWELLQGADTGGSDTNPLLITDYFLYIDDGFNGDFHLLDSVNGSVFKYTA